MLSTIALYVLSFILVGWISGLLGFLFLPLILAMGREAIGGKVHFVCNALAMFLATIAVGWVAAWLGKAHVYSLFVLPFGAMLLNNLSRIGNARASVALAYAPEQAARKKSLSAEIANFWSDLLGLLAGVAFLSPMPLY